MLNHSLCGILHFGLKSYRDKRCHVDAVPHLELLVPLQSAHKYQQERLVADQLREQLQSLLHIVTASILHLSETQYISTV